MEPRSPTQSSFNTQGLNEAVLYAGQVTRNRRRALRNAREYAAHVTRTALLDGSRRSEEGASTVTTSERYQDGERSEADSDIPTVTSQASFAPRTSSLFSVTAREPCQPVTYAASSISSWPPVSSSSSDSVVRNVLLPDFAGPTAVSASNTARRTNNSARPQASGRSLLRSRLCSSAAASSPPPAAPLVVSSAAATAITAAVAVGATVACSDLIVTNATSESGTSVASAVTAARDSTGRSASEAGANRRSILRSYLSFPPATNPTTVALSSPSGTPGVTAALTSTTPIVIYSERETDRPAPASTGSGTAGLFNFGRSTNNTNAVVSRSEENNENSDRTDQADEDSPGSPEPGSSCLENCAVCTGLPGTREAFLLHRMRNRRRRLALRSGRWGRRGIRRLQSSTNNEPPRERTQSLASYIDSEVRRVLSHQEGQESDSSDSTTRDTYQEPTALIMPPASESSRTANSSESTDTPGSSSEGTLLYVRPASESSRTTNCNESTDTLSSQSEERQQVYEMPASESGRTANSSESTDLPGSLGESTDTSDSLSERGRQLYEIPASESSLTVTSSGSTDLPSERRHQLYERPTSEFSLTASSESTDTPGSLTERRRQLYERLRNDVREMETDVRNLRNVVRHRHIEARMQYLMRYRQRRESRQRRIDERLHLAAAEGGIAGRGRIGPHSSRFQASNMRTAERRQRHRMSMADLRAR